MFGKINEFLKNKKVFDLGVLFLVAIMLTMYFLQAFYLLVAGARFANILNAILNLSFIAAFYGGICLLKLFKKNYKPLLIIFVCGVMFSYFNDIPNIAYVFFNYSNLHGLLVAKYIIEYIAYASLGVACVFYVLDYMFKIKNMFNIANIITLVAIFLVSVVWLLSFIYVFVGRDLSYAFIPFARLCVPILFLITINYLYNNDETVKVEVVEE